MRISFTGSRHGLSDWQRQQLTNLLAANAHRITDAAHGNCMGADTEFHSLVLPFVVRVHVFPSTDRRTQSPIPADAYYVASPKPPMARNPDIVAAGPDLLVACPRQLSEQPRGGTWDIVRVARSAGVKYEILWRY